MIISMKDGTRFDLDNVPISLAWNADGLLDYFQVEISGNCYRQSFTYLAGKLVSISRWVKVA